MCVLYWGTSLLTSFPVAPLWSMVSATEAVRALLANKPKGMDSITDPAKSEWQRRRRPVLVSFSFWPLCCPQVALQVSEGSYIYG